MLSASTIAGLWVVKRRGQARVPRVPQIPDVLMAKRGCSLSALLTAPSAGPRMLWRIKSDGSGQVTARSFACGYAACQGCFGSTLSLLRCKLTAVS
jgi:hypothetical protein